MEKTTLRNPKGNSGKKENPYVKKKSTRGVRKKPVLRLSKVKYEEKIVQIKRVTKVVKGGKKDDISCHCYYWR